MIVSIPSKAFLVGEYSILKGGPALLVNTTPRFSFSIKINSKLSNAMNFFHEQSAAGLWIRKNKNLFSNIHISVEDPYQSKGGFGLSSAEFASVYIYSMLKKGYSWDDVELYEIWKQYKELKKDSLVVPSGADMVSQWVGGVCLFHPSTQDVRSIMWPFSGLDFILIHTEEKLATWKHLNELEDTNFDDLIECSHRAFEFIQQEKEDDFLQAVREYHSILDKKNLVSAYTNCILQDFKKNSNILSAKGCGALGAGALILFFKKENAEEVESFIQDYSIIAKSSDITHGIEVIDDH